MNNAKKNAEVIARVQTVCPSFSKVQLSMVKNPKYGVELSAAAKQALESEGVPVPKPRKKQPARPKRTKPNRLAVYLTDEQFARAKRAMAECGTNTQDYLLGLIETDLSYMED